MYKDLEIIDGHIHCSAQTDINYLSDFIFKTNTDKALILACSHSKLLTLTPMALQMKKNYPDKFFVFSAPDVTAYTNHPNDLGEYFVSYFEDLINKGVDGIKLLEGKPQMRKKYPIPDFDHEAWEPFFKWAEEKQFPILWHVNDPEEFWDYENAPAFAISQGWLYDDSYVNNEAQYTQVLNVLKRHPKLRIDFAHFFFMSKQLNRLSNILDTYPNVYIDLTPGIEMYENFSKDINNTKAFFEKYHNRIIYGTDIGGRCVLMGEEKEFDELENTRRPEVVRDFLFEDKDILIESDGHYIINRKPFVMKGLGLSKNRLEEILSKNLLNFINK